jgi:predicted kinase
MTLYLIRGLPGSGKSTYAKSLGCLHVEADMFFMRDGIYDFRLSSLKEAHAWCLMTTRMAIENGMDVAVSNTFTQLWEMKPYRDLAKAYATPCHIVECTGNYESVHNVPQHVIDKMKEHWEEIWPLYAEPHRCIATIHKKVSQ